VSAEKSNIIDGTALAEDRKGRRRIARGGAQARGVRRVSRSSSWRRRGERGLRRAKERTCIELGMNGETIRRPRHHQDGLIEIVDN
jgi:hypothetical protein